MTDTSESFSKVEEKLIADARRTFGGFFRWVDFLDEMIKKDIGPQYGLVVGCLEADAVEQKVSGALDVSRRFKEPMAIPFLIQGETIALSHPKFEREDEATGEKSNVFDLATIHDVNRILGDVIEDYIR
ncbi:MAG: hypothetical protein C3F11_10190 [Methylocystaceae bacterium]|nr:MAG: hypothetical protein C3F11_10190 [Methylocystaceae bacterium]